MLRSAMAKLAGGGAGDGDEQVTDTGLTRFLLRGWLFKDGDEAGAVIAAGADVGADVTVDAALVLGGLPP